MILILTIIYLVGKILQTGNKRSDERDEHRTSNVQHRMLNGKR